MAYTTSFETSTVSRGAMYELLVSVDLLKKGFEVFRSVSQTSSCDIIAHKNGHLIRVEVKGRTHAKNALRRAKCTSDARAKSGRFDVIAFVHKDNIHYARAILSPLNPASEELVLNKINHLEPYVIGEGHRA